MLMVYCSNCGKEIPKDALFCSNCGTKVRTEAPSATSPSDEMRDALTKMSMEMEKAFSVAAKQVQEAFNTARENVKKTVYKEPIVCPNCGEKNVANATYCFKCGKSLSEAKPDKPDLGS
jgi:uncharacterized membrane protein YvbJ